VTSPRIDGLNSGRSGQDSNKVKAISFGQSRCTSSQKTSDMMMTASLSGHQGIMTFGNFAQLLQGQQPSRIASLARKSP